MNISTLHAVHTPCNTRIPRVFVSSIAPPLIDLSSRSKRTKCRTVFRFDPSETGESPRTIVPVAVEWLLLLFKDIRCRDRNTEYEIVFFFDVRKNFLGKRYLLFDPGDDYRLLALQMRLTSVPYLRNYLRQTLQIQLVYRRGNCWLVDWITLTLLSQMCENRTAFNEQTYSIESYCDRIDKYEKNFLLFSMSFKKDKIRLWLFFQFQNIDLSL